MFSVFLLLRICCLFHYWMNKKDNFANILNDLQKKKVIRELSTAFSLRCLPGNNLRILILFLVSTKGDDENCIRPSLLSVI